jgi:hypothetical protein
MLSAASKVYFAKRINGRWVVAVVGGLLLRAHAESKEARTVEVFAGLPQGVRARDLVEDQHR